MLSRMVLWRIGTRPQFLLTASCGQRWEVLRGRGLAGDAVSHDNGRLRREEPEDAGQRLLLCEGGKLGDRQRYLRDEHRNTVTAFPSGPFSLSLEQLCLVSAILPLSYCQKQKRPLTVWGLSIIFLYLFIYFRFTNENKTTSVLAKKGHSVTFFSFYFKNKQLYFTSQNLKRLLSEFISLRPQ